VNIKLADDTSHSFFLKVARDDVGGLGMLRGEYEGAAALYSVAPDFVPRPVGWGTYKSDPTTHFYLCDFIEMIEELPDVHKFCARLAKMHQDSIPLSPNGKFGFHVQTFEGSMYQDCTWCDSWEVFFIRAMKAFVEQEERVHGPHPDLQELLPQLYEKVCSLSQAP
jgi:protein-ribulosamine 3-kinase